MTAPVRTNQLAALHFRARHFAMEFFGPHLPFSGMTATVHGGPKLIGQVSGGPKLAGAPTVGPKLVGRFTNLTATRRKRK